MYNYKLYLCKGIFTAYLNMTNFRRVDEFSEYGDLDMMMQYVKDIQTVQRKLADCTDSITFINEVNSEGFYIK